MTILVISEKLTQKYSNYLSAQILNFPFGNHHVLINSQGGELIQAWAISDLLLTRGVYSAHNEGICSSAALIIFARASYKTCDKWSYFECHKPTGLNLTETDYQLKKMNNLLGISKEQVWTAQQALECQLVHAIY